MRQSQGEVREIGVGKGSVGTGGSILKKYKTIKRLEQMEDGEKYCALVKNEGMTLEGCGSKGKRNPLQQQ